MGGLQQSLVKPFSKAVPQSKGIIQTAVTGIGFDQVLKIGDNLIGAPLQKFGFNVPIIGRVSLIDSINYLVHNQGSLLPKKGFKGFIAVGAAKASQGGFNILGRFGSGAKGAPGTGDGTGGGV